MATIVKEINDTLTNDKIFINNKRIEWRYIIGKECKDAKHINMEEDCCCSNKESKNKEEDKAKEEDLEFEEIEKEEIIEDSENSNEVKIKELEDMKNKLKEENKN